MTKRKSGSFGMMYYQNHPSEYGYICPHCQRRYGARQHLGVVDVVRCTQCPSMADAGQHYLEKRREGRRDRYERAKV
jgi:DNA-directed RNA polymerase subunit RPC12/RpoP